ncbi:MAG: hypothetical protein H6755_04965 [Candidatus Omnitrophica bacterium]|nr:hypothetical protein [Candidatus Omnitrophota bacterium]MCB9747743.1 hypothetical protein [Candidatus Omnitrophota bacterium]
MEITYGQGTYQEKNKKFTGQIILSDHKVFIKTPQEDLPQTFIPLEKIERLKQSSNSVDIQVRLTIMIMYTATITGQKKNISDLVKDIVKRRGLKKKFFKNEWIEEKI